MFLAVHTLPRVPLPPILDSGLHLPYIQDVGKEGGAFYHRGVHQLCGGSRVSDEHAGSAVYPPRRGHAVIAG